MKVKLVPECPSCGSNKTGYYIPMTSNYKREKTKKFLKGERVRQKEPFSLNSTNCFCQSCGQNWNGQIKKVDFDNDEFQDYLIERGFIEERNKIRSELEKYKKRKKDIKKAIKENKNWYKAFSIALLIATGIDIRHIYKDNKEKEE